MREYKCFPHLNRECEYRSGSGLDNQNYYGRGYIQLVIKFNIV
jgi:hypothetical protein